MPVNFNHAELMFLNRLLCNHVVGEWPKVFDSLTNKLMDYAKRETGDFETLPLDVHIGEYHQGRRTVIQVAFPVPDLADLTDVSDIEAPE